MQQSIPSVSSPNSISVSNGREETRGFVALSFLWLFRSVCNRSKVSLSQQPCQSQQRETYPASSILHPHSSAYSIARTQFLHNRPSGYVPLPSHCKSTNQSHQWCLCSKHRHRLWMLTQESIAVRTQKSAHTNTSDCSLTLTDGRPQWILSWESPCDLVSTNIERI